MLGENVEVHVLEIAGGQVKLGIRAPQSVSVMRREILTAARQNRASAVPIPEAQVRRLLENLKKPGGRPIRPV